MLSGKKPIIKGAANQSIGVNLILNLYFARLLEI
jgi:hypothetical protein